MYNKQIYYVVQATTTDEQNKETDKFYSDEDLIELGCITKEEKKLYEVKKTKTIKKFFRGNTPKKLRKQAFNYFKELRDTYFLNYTYKNTEPTNDIIDSSEKNLYIFKDNSYYKLDLIIAFGFETNEDSLECKDTYPIGAIGFHLEEIESILKINLLIEYENYLKSKFNTPKIIKETNFHLFNNLKNYLINYLTKQPEYNSNSERKFVIDFITKYLLNEEPYQYNYFKTPQFYNIDFNEYTTQSNLFIKELKKKNNFIKSRKIKVYKKELTLLNKVRRFNKQMRQFYKICLLDT